jgi:hypothetical protein
MKEKVIDTVRYGSNELDGVFRALVTFVLLGWNTIEGAVFEHRYPVSFVRLYPYPIWRLLLVLTLYLGAAWTPDVGVMMAFFIFFYGMDMEVTLEKWVEE